MRYERTGELVPAGGGDNIPLIRDKLTIGRRESCDICLRFPNVSGIHCELEFQDGIWVIRDLGSKNGVKVDGVKIKQKQLRDGSEVAIANRLFVIRYRMRGGPQNTMNEILDDEENILEKSLLERAGLVRPAREDAGKSSRRGRYDLTADDD
jgi:adenylate cyclase